MKARILFMVTLALMMAGAVTPVAADNEAVPFMALYTAYPQAVFNPSTGCLEQVIPADGRATYLGESAFYTGDMRSCLDGSQHGAMTFTAANGDELYGSFVGTWYIDSNGVAHFQGTYQFAGGLGRFAKASGAGDYWGTAQGGLGELHFAGTISNLGTLRQ